MLFIILCRYSDLYPILAAHLAVHTKHNNLYRYIPLSLLTGRLRDTYQSAAARNLHYQYGKCVDLRDVDHLHQFIDIRLRIAVQFRTSYCKYLAAQEPAVKIAAGKRRAIGRQQQIGALKESGLRIYKV